MLSYLDENMCVCVCVHLMESKLAWGESGSGTVFWGTEDRWSYCGPREKETVRTKSWAIIVTEGREGHKPTTSLMLRIWCLPACWAEGDRYIFQIIVLKDERRGFLGSHRLSLANWPVPDSVGNLFSKRERVIDKDTWYQLLTSICIHAYTYRCLYTHKHIHLLIYIHVYTDTNAQINKSS